MTACFSAGVHICSVSREHERVTVWTLLLFPGPHLNPFFGSLLHLQREPGKQDSRPFPCRIHCHYGTYTHDHVANNLCVGNMSAGGGYSADVVAAALHRNRQRHDEDSLQQRLIIENQLHSTISA